jgi:protein transport protein SEC61 subunit gamma-like protein
MQTIQNQGLKARLKRFFKETVRVLRITKRPGREEFMTAAKVTGLGISAIGFVGFIIFLLKQLFFTI